MIGKIEMGEGVVLTPATAEDFAALNADMRDADRAECGVFGAKGEDPADWGAAWAIRDGEDFVGIVGWTRFWDTLPISEKRLLLLMTTNAVWKRKKKYVKYSALVMRRVCRELPEWVSDVYTLPMSAYTASIKWQKKVLGFVEVGEELLNGVKHTRLHAKRNEVEL